MKKTWLTISAILIFFIALLGTYQYFSKPNIVAPISTGGDKSQDVPNEYESEAAAMEAISKALPIKTPYFSINFSFKKGKYIVTNIKSSNLQLDFDNWYNHSDFKEIPKSRFLIDD